MTATRYCQTCRDQMPLGHTCPPGNPSLFDVPEAEARRDEAIRRVDEHAEPDVKAALLASVEYLARVRHEFTSDDVWQDYREHAGDESPHEPRVLGAVMRRAALAGWIAATDRFELSKRPETHRSPKRVWRSLVAA